MKYLLNYADKINQTINIPSNWIVVTPDSLIREGDRYYIPNQKRFRPIAKKYCNELVKNTYLCVIRHINSSSSIEDMNVIGNFLSDKTYYGYGLKAEILFSAMHFLKNNPSASIKAALDYGYGEWIK